MPKFTQPVKLCIDPACNQCLLLEHIFKIAPYRARRETKWFVSSALRLLTPSKAIMLKDPLWGKRDCFQTRLDLHLSSLATTSVIRKPPSRSGKTCRYVTTPMLRVPGCQTLVLERGPGGPDVPIIDPLGVPGQRGERSHWCGSIPVCLMTGIASPVKSGRMQSRYK